MKFKLRRSFKQTITITMILISTLPIVILGFFSLYYINGTLTQSVEDRLKETLISSDKLISNALTQYKEGIQLLLDDDQIRQIAISDKLKEEDINYLKSQLYGFVGSQSEYINIYMIKDNGEYYGSNELPERYQIPLYKNWGIYREVNKSGSIFLYPNNTRMSSQFQNALSFIGKVEVESTIKAYIILDISSEYLQNIIRTVKRTSFGYTQFIVTSSSNEIIYNDSAFTNSIHFLDNVFQYDRFSVENAKEISVELNAMLMESYTNKEYQFTYYGLIPKSVLDSQSKALFWVFAILTLMVFFVALLIGIISSQKISAPIVALANSMRDYEEGNDNKIIEGKRENEIDEIYFQFHHLMKRINEFYKEDLEKQSLLRQAEIKSLMAQINPHFLYNTLESIKWKAKLKETEDIAIMVSELGVLLKASMDTRTTLVSVKEEIKFVESYMSLQQFRYTDRFHFEMVIEEGALAYIIPKLILQPIIENSIIHGIEPLSTKGTIELYVWVVEAFLFFSISDNGIGSDLTFEEILKMNSKSIGLHNVNQRIKLYYGDEYELKWQSEKAKGTIVLIQIPLHMKGDV
ncbi:MAG: sensor histidine kinase [Breznakia sp.]